MKFWHHQHRQRHQHEWEEYDRKHMSSVTYYAGERVGEDDFITMIYWLCKTCGKRTKEQIDGWEGRNEETQRHNYPQ